MGNTVTKDDRPTPGERINGETIYDKTRQLFRDRYAVTDLGLRMLDIVIVSIMLLLSLILFILIALAITLDSKGSILFVQERVGLRGKTFKCFKFRSMTMNAEKIKANLAALNERSGPVFKIENDPRVTRVGRFLRKYSLDELPQLLNIITGDMSLVGPRPGTPAEVNKYPDHAYGRLAVRPGLTGLWQVSGRAKIGFNEMVELDLKYIRKRSIFEYLRIVVLTIPAVLGAKGAY